MSDIESTKLLTVASQLFNNAAVKLKGQCGKNVEIMPLEAKPFDSNAVKEVFPEQPVTIQIGWGDEEFGLFLFIAKSTFSQTMPILSGREGEWTFADEQSPAELETVFKAALSGVEQAFLESTKNEAQLGEPKVQVDEGPDEGMLTDFWMIPVDFKLESAEPARVLCLLSPAFLEAMLVNTEEAEEKVHPIHDDKITVSEGAFSSITESEIGASSGNNLDMLMDVELPIAVELGRVNMIMKEILGLGPGAVVELNKFSGEPVDLFVNNKKFAEGEVVVIDQNFGVRITALVGPNERINAAKEGVN